jgi:hypothetical protein
MILFTLRCSAGHEFEAWFRDGATYERQAKRSLIACPECGSHEVEKALMAPRLGRSSKSEVAERPGRPVEPEILPAAPQHQERPPTPAEFRRALQVLRRYVEKNCEHVGPRFAEEARKIHRGEADARGIYGDASPEEAKQLAEEGIEVAAIPWVPSSDA